MEKDEINYGICSEIIFHALHEGWLLLRKFLLFLKYQFETMHCSWNLEYKIKINRAGLC